MFYKDFKGLKISALGMGAMRLPVIDGDDSRPDTEKVFEMVDFAMKSGVNYYDTAWGYHSGNSERVMGKALSRYPRESFFLASKFPGYDLSNMDKVEEIFNKQLEKCGVDYFDFYLFHNVCELNIDCYLDERYGIYDHLMKQKENGRIRHLGFSAHGSRDVIKRFLERYGRSMEFCQLQLNYIDMTFQKDEEKIELIREYGLPIWVMEPLRGGMLASLSDENASKLRRLCPNDGIPVWAFRYLESIPDVTVILSGMSDLTQLKDNINTFSVERPLDENEKAVLSEIAEEMIKSIVLPCTACRYCTSHCPMELDIPMLLELYNEHKFTGGGFIAPMALGSIEKDKQPSACIGCRSCEQVCPQQIKISEAMSDFSSMLG
ncbi:MAG: aldo/keto reductase [Clostridiales bacterium]|nr:aldo/keto reductase [Clostridiales bacterium]